LGSNVEAITEVRDLETMMMDELFVNFLTYELKNNQEKEMGEKRKDKNLVLKATEKDDSREENISLMMKSFQKMQKPRSFEKPSEDDRQRHQRPIMPQMQKPRSFHQILSLVDYGIQKEQARKGKRDQERSIHSFKS